MNAILAILALSLPWQPGGEGLIIEGMASQYAPGVMERVIETRQAGRTAKDLPANLDGYTVFVAVEDCALVGTEFEIRPEGSGRWERAIVCDCSGHAETSAWMILGGILVEVDYQTAVRWGTVGRGILVEIRAGPPPLHYPR